MVNDPDADAKFEVLVDELLREAFRRLPVWATECGFRGVDDDLGNFSLGAFHELINFGHYALHRLRSEIPLDGLSFENQIDYEVLTRKLSATLELARQTRPWETDPTLYITAVIDACYGLYVGEVDSFQNCLRFMLDRMSQIPRVLKEGMKNLRNPSIEHTHTAIEITEGGFDFFRHILRTHQKELSSITSNYDELFRRVEESFHLYHRFLKRDLLPLAKRVSAVGPEIFDFMLRELNFCGITRSDLLKLGQTHLHEARRDLEQLSQRLGFGKNWRGLLLKDRKDYPRHRNLMECYRETIDRAKQFVVDQKVVSLPRTGHLILMETPEFDRPIIPLAAYVPGAPLVDGSPGLFFVTPVKWTPFWWRLKKNLIEHNRSKVNVTVVHESYPGHHLQYTRAREHPSRLRRLFDDDIFSEGWAMYAEELMLELGFDRDPITQLHVKRNVLWRALRVILDVELQSRNISTAQGIEMLMNQIGLDFSFAHSEIHRYLLEPTQPLSYLVGKIEILRLKRECEKRWGDQFSLRDFHDRLLGAGELPIKMLEKALMGPEENQSQALGIR